MTWNMAAADMIAKVPTFVWLIVGIVLTLLVIWAAYTIKKMEREVKYETKN